MITLPMLSTKERLREKNLEIRSLQTRIRRKDEYILNLARALKACKSLPPPPPNNPRYLRGPTYPLPLTHLLLLFLTSSMILYLIHTLGPHFTPSSVCSPVRPTALIMTYL